MQMQLLMLMVFVGQESVGEPTNAAAKEAGAYLMVALLAMGGAAILVILVMTILSRRMRKRKLSGDWRLDWEVEGEGEGGGAWQKAGERATGDDFEGDDESRS